MSNPEFHTGDEVTVCFASGDQSATIYRPPNSGGWAIVESDKGIRTTVHTTKLKARKNDERW